MADRSWLTCLLPAGTHYEWTKRLAGIRYASLTHPSQRSPSYHVLGVLLFLQLALSAGGQQVTAQPCVAVLCESLRGCMLGWWCCQSCQAPCSTVKKP